MKIYLNIVLLTLLLQACDHNEPDSKQVDTTQSPSLVDYTYVVNLGDQATALDASDSGHGFSTPIPTLTASELAQHLRGDALFETAFTTTPNNEHPELDGLGPVFNNQDCNSCHQRDGRSSTLTVPEGEQRILLSANAGIFLRMSIDDGLCIEPSAANNYCKNVPVPEFGTQLFHRGVLKAREDWQEKPFVGQADVYLGYQYSQVNYDDGESVMLKKPVFDIASAYDVSPENIAHSNIMQADVRYSPRNGMPVFGLGLLELIPQQDILALADENDDDQDGISGRPNWVFDAIKARDNDPIPVSLGRFGWKANTPSVRVQSLGALRGDMGITNPLFPEESIANTLLHQQYLTRTNFVDTGMDEQGNTEASQAFADDVVFYAETLAVPARRKVDDPNVVAGAIVYFCWLHQLSSS